MNASPRGSRSVDPCSTIILLAFICLTFLPSNLRADEFDTARSKWKILLTGSSPYVVSDTNVYTQLSHVYNNGNNNNNSIAKPPTTYLWSNKTSITISQQITDQYNMLYAMALAYSTPQQNLYQNTALATDIIAGLDWMYANRYNENKVMYDNWYDWQIAAPIYLNNCVILMYDQLSPTQIANYMRAVDYWSNHPNTGFTGANLAWSAQVIAGRAIIAKDSVKLHSAVVSLSALYTYSTTGDGFYTDGSFVQHTYYAYTGGYAPGILEALSYILPSVNGTSFQPTDPNTAVIWDWIYNAFAPVIYKGEVMDMVSGRNYTRGPTASGHYVLQDVIKPILRLAAIAPTNDATSFKGACKYWIQSDTYLNQLATSRMFLPDVIAAEAVLNDSSIAPMAEPHGCSIFSGMARTTHFQTGWAAAISLNSKRNANYEVLNNENVRGWYTSDGLVSLYTADLAQYSDAYWPTVNLCRLPGTTVDTQARADSSGWGYRSPTANWAGGATLDDLYGSVGMALDAWNSTLVAHKSWFLFDQEIVALGSGISSTDGRTIETIVENRQLNSSGSNALTINGTPQPSTLGWSATIASVSTIYLQGNTASGADIGYYFPGGATVKGLREARMGAWSNINYSQSPNTFVRNYMALWLDHGINPTNATYAYFILPNKSSTAVTAYAAAPRVQVLSNTSQVQAVKNTPLNITAANIWVDGTNSINGMITVDKKASLLFQDGSTLKIAVSDPTQANTGIINVTINKPASATLSAAPGITIDQLSPVIKFHVNVNGALGRSFLANFSPALPSPWSDADIGTVGLPGSASYAFSAFTISASGADVGGTADQFHYIYKTLSGHGQLIVRLASQSMTGSDLWAKAGIMVRESTSPGSKFAYIYATPGNGFNFELRDTNFGAATNWGPSTAGNAPKWFKIVRSGTYVLAYISDDGVNWGSAWTSKPLGMGSTVLIGMAVTSHDNTKISSGIFANVQ